MEILLDRLIVVSDGSLADGINVVSIVHTVVAKIVANTRN